MNIENVRPVMAAARACAMQMMQNGDYIQCELPSIPMPDELRTMVAELCNELISTKHDVFTELFELDDALSAPEVRPEDVKSLLDRVSAWLSEDVVQINEVVEAIRKQVDADGSCMMAAMLLMESATNILTPFNDFQSLMDRIKPSV